MLRLIPRALERRSLSSEVGRVALSAQFVCLHNSVENANKGLMEIMPSKYAILLDNEEDVVVQVNVRLPGRTLPETKLNIIQTWSVTRFQVLGIAASLDLGAISTLSAPLTDMPLVIGSSLNIEANNATLNRPLTTREQGDLFNEELEIIQRTVKSLNVNVEGFDD